MSIQMDIENCGNLQACHTTETRIYNDIYKKQGVARAFYGHKRSAEYYSDTRGHLTI